MAKRPCTPVCDPPALTARAKTAQLADRGLFGRHERRCHRSSTVSEDAPPTCPRTAGRRLVALASTQCSWHGIRGRGPLRNGRSGVHRCGRGAGRGHRAAEDGERRAREAAGVREGGDSRTGVPIANAWACCAGMRGAKKPHNPAPHALRSHRKNLVGEIRFPSGRTRRVQGQALRRSAPTHVPLVSRSVSIDAVRPRTQG